MYVNAAAVKLFGAPAEGILGTRCNDAPWQSLHTDGTPLTLERLACHRALTEGATTSSAEQVIRRPDGTEAVVLASGAPLHDEDGALVGAVTSYADISERVRADEILHERAERDASLLRLYASLGAAETYREILAACTAELLMMTPYRSVWLCWVDETRENAYLVNAEGDGASLSVRVIKEIGDRYRREVEETTFLKLPVHGDPMMEEIAECTHIVVLDDARTDPRANKEITAVSDNRTIINVPLLLGDRMVGALGMGSFGDEGPMPPTPEVLEYLKTLSNHVAVAMDRVFSLRQRAEAEYALAVSEERYRQFVETSFEGVWALDADMKTVYATTRMAELLGCAPEDMVGRSLLDFVFEEDTGDVLARMARRRAGEKASHEMRFRRCDGSAVWLHMSAAPLFGPGGEYQGSFAMATDISARKVAEARLAAALQRTNLVLEGVVSALSATTSQRDPYTALHQERVARLAVAIAKDMGSRPRFIEGLRIAALLHDVGKIAIPSEILSRPGALSDMEMGLIQTHASIGYAMLEHVPFDAPVAKVVLQHHERSDGSGYPSGLYGDEILLQARILAVADVVEAMASHRPYRPALGLDAALDEVTAKSGAAFDERVVTSCVRVARGVMTLA